MNKSPLISIVTIVYNGDKHLEQTILSVTSQSYPNVEYIIIDGGSTDKTVEIIKKHESRIKYWISEKDKGVSDAFNKGLSQATGEFVGIINADDWYAPDAFSAVSRFFADSDVIYGDMQMWKGDKKEYVVQGNHNLLESEMSVNHPTVFVRKSCYENEGAFNPIFKCAMDYELLLRLKLRNYRFRHVSQVIAHMRWDGVSDSKWLLGCKETLDIKNKYIPGRKTRHLIYYYNHILAIGLPKFFKSVGLNFIVKFYRSNFSTLKKDFS
ncbi:MAG: glycosyltransferase [Chitinophagaceae bacterium]|nr:MAG: glycosyltransferase [Chitinophagaceae bacterium]